MDARTFAQRIHADLESSPRQNFPTRDMSTVDDLSHNFREDFETTVMFLEKYGQVFMNGTRYTL